MQSTARKDELPLDKMCLISEVTNFMTRDNVSAAAPQEGAYIHGLFMEVHEVFLHQVAFLTQGARWDLYAGSIAESKLKDLHPPMPVMFIKAVTQDIGVSVPSSPSCCVFLNVLAIQALHLCVKLKMPVSQFQSVKHTVLYPVRLRGFLSFLCIFLLLPIN